MKSFFALVPIRFSDIDAFGHVNHARYLTYCEDHRTAMFAQMGEESGSWLLDAGFSIARLECDYLRPLLLSDREVGVRCTIEAVGKTSVRLRYELEVPGEIVARVRTVIVVSDETGPRPWSEAERQWFSTYLVEFDEAQGRQGDGDQS